MNIPQKISSHNFRAFLWHAGFLALAQNFMDVDTVIPAMLIDSGGNAFHIGLMTAIMLGGSSLSQIFFAPYISNKSYKKGVILLGINSRVLSLIALGIILFFVSRHQSQAVLLLLFFFITTFSLSGAFANIGYVDIVGKAINPEKRKKFLSSRQIISGVVVLMSAFLAKQIITTGTFPVNYAYSFFIGGLLLLIASVGFWQVKENIASDFKIGTLTHFLRILKSELIHNKKLVFFLGYINTQGIAISFMPFVVLYSKEFYNSQSSDAGNFLLNKIIGVVLVSLLVLIYSKKIKYNILLIINVFFSVIMAIAVLIINEITILNYVFILGGIVFSLYNISMNGVLLEVSGTKNRALYAGFVGAGNILPALFPLAGGWLIQQWGFNVFFTIFIVIVSSAFWFIWKMNCQK